MAIVAVLGVLAILALSTQPWWLNDAANMLGMSAVVVASALSVILVAVIVGVGCWMLYTPSPIVAAWRTRNLCVASILFGLGAPLGSFFFHDVEIYNVLKITAPDLTFLSFGMAFFGWWYLGKYQSEYVELCAPELKEWALRRPR